MLYLWSFLSNSNKYWQIIVWRYIEWLTNYFLFDESDNNFNLYNLIVIINVYRENNLIGHVCIQE